MSEIKFHVGKEIEHLMGEKRVDIDTIAKKLKYTNQNVYQILKKQSIKSDLVLSFCEILDTSPNRLLGYRQPYVENENISIASDTKAHYTTTLDTLKETIAAQKETISLLQQKVAELQQKIEDNQQNAE